MKTIAVLAALAVTGTAVTGCAHDARPAANARHTAAPLSALDLRSARSLADSIAARQAAAGSSANVPGSPVRLRAIDYSAVVSDAGGRDAYTVFITVTQTGTVQRSSAATLGRFRRGVPVFTSAADKTRWRAAGSPREEPPARGEAASLPAGQFSFMPQGAVLSYQQAVSLPGSPGRLASAIMNHLLPYAGARPPAALVLKALAYLIASAPMTGAARAAAWKVLALLPGLRLCTLGPDLSGRRGHGLCADSGDDESAVLVDPGTGAVLAAEDRLLAPSPLYPMVPSGTLIGERTFLSP